jgi:hypothetical protein
MGKKIMVTTREAPDSIEGTNRMGTTRWRLRRAQTVSGWPELAD